MKNLKKEYIDLYKNYIDLQSTFTNLLTDLVLFGEELKCKNSLKSKNVSTNKINVDYVLYRINEIVMEVDTDEKK